MEVELLTTKKKLTKALLTQCRTATADVMERGDVLGYVIGVIKDHYKAVLVMCDGDLYKVAANWSLGRESVYRSIGKWSQKLSFENGDALEKWRVGYERVLGLAKNQIYI